MKGGGSGQSGDQWGWKDFSLGNEPTMQCADDVLLSCILETYMVLLTNQCHLNKFNKKYLIKY